MKKLFTVFAAVLLAVSAAAFAACAPRTPATVTLGENAVLITPSSEVLGITAETTLADYMDELVSRNELEYEAADGMITSINGRYDKNGSAIVDVTVSLLSRQDVEVLIGKIRAHAKILDVRRMAN